MRNDLFVRVRLCVSMVNKVTIVFIVYMYATWVRDFWQQLFPGEPCVA